MQHGIILLDKRAGVSSARAIAEVKKRLPIERIGHAGTLDPFATGLLVCLVGRATRLASYAQHGTKEYEGVARFGCSSDTDDCTGAVIKSDAPLPSFAAIEQCAVKFRGEISQVPPRISAVKIDGKRAYRRARAGEEFTISPRTVTVEDLSLWPISESEVGFRVRCSSGTYIRSLFRDLAAAAGSAAVLTMLRRTYSAPFAVTQAHGVDDLTSEHVTGIEILLPHVPVIPIDTAERVQLMGGQERTLRALSAREVARGGTTEALRLCRVGSEERACGVLEWRRGALGIIAMW